MDKINNFYSYIIAMTDDLLKYVSKRVENPCDVEDIVYSTLLAAWEHKRLVLSASDPRPYLFKIARNQLYDYRQRQASGPVLTADIDENIVDVEGDVLLSLVRTEESDEVVRSMNRLDPAYNRILQMCYLDLASVRAVSDALGLNYCNDIFIIELNVIL